MGRARRPPETLPPTRETIDARRRLSAMRLGLLTGGGDCPGLNAAIRAVTDER